MILKPELDANTALSKDSHKPIVACVFLCVALLLPAHAIGQSSIAPMVLSTATLPPLTTPDENGYLDRLYAEWFARAELRVELIAVPAARGLENANAGLFDGDAARINIETSLYPNLLKVPEPLIPVVFSGLYLESSVRVKTSAEFEKYRVGYVRGWRIAEDMFADSQNAVAVRDPDGLLDMLVAKRIDIAFLTIAPARKAAREKNLPYLQSTDLKFKKDVYLYLHSRHRDKIPKLTKTLRAMKSDGSYDLIMTDYVAENQ